MNEDHCNWLDRLMDKAMFAIVADDVEDEESQKIKADVVHFFNHKLQVYSIQLDNSHVFVCKLSSYVCFGAQVSTLHDNRHMHLVFHFHNFFSKHSYFERRT